MPRRTLLPPGLARRPFTVAEAHALGLGEGRLRHQELSRPAHGVRPMGSTEDLTQRAAATILALPVGSALLHVTAARLLGLPLPLRWTPTEPLHVMNVTGTARTRRAGCEGHRGLESRRVMQRNGLRS